MSPTCGQTLVEAWSNCGSQTCVRGGGVQSLFGSPFNALLLRNYTDPHTPTVTFSYTLDYAAGVREVVFTLSPTPLNPTP